MKYRVPVKCVTTEWFLVEADSPEEAANLALEDADPDHCRLVEEIEGECEAYVPDIKEVPE